MQNEEAGFLRSEWSKFTDRCRWSWAGWLIVWREESSVKQWVFANIISAGFALTLDLAPVERALIIALGVLILAAECFNTAIERCVDYTSPAHHPLAKAAKDCGSAAVAITAIAAGLAWLIILFG
ncbi:MULTISPECIES: diacylglycerol kinase [Halocynthiibacter]|uniref:Diacylglycerol kinase n=1 Tax=Halocynthiibacter halioticoli TaxID=2986804 RepID=A0AAE3LQP8_9RHOB|nr:MULTISPECIES: diacylglycerol kinase [Halocynthiibacter]MCV6823739.1 diacylglycerol kinase [Halocynthiibacter halioticoli]MCW4056740.1 diacylglycerol kinase [Halocynthiibacter sp. SDUM655004]